MNITITELRNIIEGSIAAGNECLARGSRRAAEVHFETADHFASKLSLMNIKDGRGI